MCKYTHSDGFWLYETYHQKELLDASVGLFLIHFVIDIASYFQPSTENSTVDKAYRSLKSEDHHSRDGLHLVECDIHKGITNKKCNYLLLSEWQL